MPSDRPPPEQSSPGSDPARRRTTLAVRDGTLVFAIVLGSFVAYALGVTATYRASAIVAVEPLPGSGPVELPKPAEASDRLRRAALEPSVVSRLAAEERSVPPETQSQVGTRLSNALTVESRDARSFSFSMTAPSAERAQHVVNEFAQQAAKRALLVLDPPREAPPDPGARAKAELLEFLAAHPGIANEPIAAPARSGPDPLVLALRAEKTRIESKLNEPPAPAGDNPYDEPGPLEKPEFLKRRLREIDSALEARAKPPAPRASASAAAKEPSREVRAEWQRLLRAVSETRGAEPPVQPPGPRLRVTLARAGLPRLPVEPNRPQLVLIGVILACLAGVLAAFLRSQLEARAVRRYGIKTGEHPIVPLPQTTLRLSRDQLPKPAEPQVGALPTPVPTAPPNTGPITPIPPAPLVPAPITPIPPAPIAPKPITPIPAAPHGTAEATPIPGAPVGKADAKPIQGAPVLAPTTPVPPRSERAAPLAPTLIASITKAAEKPAAPVPAKATGADAPPTTQPLPDIAAAAKAAEASKSMAASTVAGTVTPTPPGPTAAPLPTPIPPGGVAPPAGEAVPATPLVIQGPSSASPVEGPPTTQGYGEPEKVRGRGGRRVTKIYGTPPTPNLEEEAKALRTTQAYGSPPAALASPRHLPAQGTPIPAEVLPPEHKSSLQPTPMIPIARSSTPPPVTHSVAPLSGTGYSYVQTPVPEAHSIPQTPIPRRPSPPPRTEPYGSIPPVQPRSSQAPPNASSAPPAPMPSNPPAVVVRTHPVPSNWRPDPVLSAGRRKAIAAEVLTLAVERCLVIGVTGVRGSTDKKSIAAAELALALAEAKHPRVLLMESDFHFPQVQKWLGVEVPFSAGFSQQLRGRIDGAREGRWHVVECKSSLHVLAEGVMRSPGLLLSNQFEQAMRELRGYYDIIVIDAPSAPSESDGQAIADVVDGAIVVGPASRSGEIMEVSRIFSGKKLLRAIES